MKKIYLLLILFTLSCSQNPVQTNNPGSSAVKETTKSFPDTFDVGKGKKGANISVKINFKTFKTKDSVNGTAAKTVDDINAVRLYLTTSNGSNPLLAENIKFTSAVLAYNPGDTSRTYTFSNVPEGTFFVAVELFSDISGTVNITEPITYDSATSGDTAFGFAEGKRGLTLSSNSATVIVPSMTFTFSDSTSAFSVVPNLLNATGAVIDTTVNAQAGSGVILNSSIGIQ